MSVEKRNRLTLSAAFGQRLDLTSLAIGNSCHESDGEVVPTDGGDRRLGSDGVVLEGVMGVGVSGGDDHLVVAVEVEKTSSLPQSPPPSVQSPTPTPIQPHHSEIDPSHAPAPRLVHPRFPHSIGFVPDVKPLQALPTHIDGCDVWLPIVSGNVRLIQELKHGLSILSKHPHHTNTSPSHNYGFSSYTSNTTSSGPSPYSDAETSPSIAHARFACGSFKEANIMCNWLNKPATITFLRNSAVTTVYRRHEQDQGEDEEEGEEEEEGRVATRQPYLPSLQVQRRFNAEIDRPYQSQQQNFHLTLISLYRNPYVTLLRS